MPLLQDGVYLQETDLMSTGARISVEIKYWNYKRNSDSQACQLINTMSFKLTIRQQYLHRELIYT
jgi:hypothetical protein